MVYSKYTYNTILHFFFCNYLYDSPRFEFSIYLSRKAHGLYLIMKYVNIKKCYLNYMYNAIFAVTFKEAWPV